MGNKIYLIGATGNLGRVVSDKINAIPLVRRESRLKGEITTDFSIEQLKKILKDAKVIVHVAGSINSLDKEKMYEANVELTKKIVEAAPKNCKIVFAGSVSVYGKKLAETPANETTKPNPDSAYAKSKYEAESIVTMHSNHVILRIGPIYGPGFKDYYRVIELAKKRKMKIIGDGKNRIPFVHVEDVAKAIANAVKKGKGTYVIAGEPLTQEEIFKLASKELGVETPHDHISLRSALLLTAFGEILYKITGKKPIFTREHISILAYDRAFDCSKAKNELGFAPRPLEQGIKEMVDNYKKQKIS